MARVLIVEDDELVRRVLCGIVRAAGHRCHCVGTKAEAIQLLAPGSHALAIADVMLPDGRGHAVVERAVELGIHAILMSGHPDAIGSFANGNAGCLAKPFGLDEFEKVLRDNVHPP